MLKLEWTRLDEVDGYDIYLGKCGYDASYKATLSGRASCSYQFRNLEKGATYKSYVRAWKWVDGQKTYVDESPYVHALTGDYNSTLSNVRSVKLNRRSLLLNKGNSKKLKSTVNLVKSGRKALDHEKPVRYFSSNVKVATVQSDGRVRAVGKGRCIIYAIAVNGIRASVKITVR